MCSLVQIEKSPCNAHFLMFEAKYSEMDRLVLNETSGPYV